MNITLQRTSSGPTFGKLSAEICFTLEDAIRDTKVHGQTAIPAGRYRIELVNSPRFGPDTISLIGVPNFENIRIHGGNTVDDTEGCPLVGLELTQSGIKGGTSQPALRILKSFVKAAIAEKQQVWIEVKNP